MAIGTVLANDLVVFSSAVHGTHALGLVRSVSGTDVYVDIPAKPAAIPLHIQVADIIARYSATATRV